MIQRRVLVSGQVQGVGFRAALAKEARRYPGVLGFVRNRSNGQVEAVFAAENLADVLALVAWCRRGPESARVESLEVFEETPAHGWSGFTVWKDA